MSSLLVKKLALAFALGFLPVLLLGLTDLTSQIQESTASGNTDSTGWGWFLVSLLAGAVSTGIRAVTVGFNLMPTDPLHAPNKSTESVTVTTDS
jgi:hypothetical protein